MLVYFTAFSDSKSIIYELVFLAKKNKKKMIFI